MKQNSFVDTQPINHILKNTDNQKLVKAFRKLYIGLNCIHF